MKRCLVQRIINALARFHEAFDGTHGFIEHRLLVLVHFDLDDLFDAASTDHCGDADIEPVEAIGPLNMRSAGQNALLVLEKRLGHLDRGGGGA